MTASSEITARIGRAIELTQRGEGDEARGLFTQLWQEIGPDGDGLHRLSVAHWMADLQEDPREELEWDLRAMTAAQSVSDAQAAQAGVTAVASFYPSLHLNLGDDYRKLGDLDAARRHCGLGLEAAEVLGDDGYSQMIKGGLHSLAARLADL